MSGVEQVEASIGFAPVEEERFFPGSTGIIFEKIQK
jgi:hypothetical protein